MKKNYRKQAHQKIINLRAAHPDYLQLDGENDELIVKLIYVETMNNGKTVGEIEDNLTELRAAHPDYLQLDGENEELIKRFTEIFNKDAPEYNQYIYLKKYAFVDEPINQQIADEFEYLNEEAVILLLNRPRISKKAFIKKLDIYSIVMRKKLMDPTKY